MLVHVVVMVCGVGFIFRGRLRILNWVSREKNDQTFIIEKKILRDQIYKILIFFMKLYIFFRRF
jgi:hypothetical protein